MKTLKMKLGIILVCVTALFHAVNAHGVHDDPPAPVECIKCPINPCSLVRIACAQGSSLTPDFCRCTCTCQLTLPTVFPPLTHLPPPVEKCRACLCRNCGINGRCVADNDRCLEACDLTCRKVALCKMNPCELHANKNKCNANEICVAKCGSCSEVNCLPATKPKNPCLHTKCGVNEKCIVDGCRSKCVSKCKTCVAHPCAAITCLSAPVVDLCACTCQCKPTLPTVFPPLTHLPPPVEKCRACLCRNCGINGRCVADNDRCLEACDLTCRKGAECKSNPCELHANKNKCNANEICVAKCGSCSEVKCLAATKPKNPCLHTKCGVNEKCIVDGCRSKCVSKCKTCVAHPCAATTCGPFSTAVADLCACTCQCKPCFQCLAVLCQPNTCPSGKKCVQAPCGCSYKCVDDAVCDPCSKVECKKNFKCIANTKSCTARCERRCPTCNNKHLCENKKCGKNQYCGVTCHNCRAICRPIKSCRRKPCRGARCGKNFQCVNNFKTCTHYCEPCDRPCARIDKPVCGTDGQTYTNQCVLDGAICKSRGKLAKKHDGKCKCVDKCPVIKCGFNARCVFDQETCQSRCDCPRYKCTADYKPICGTDGKTYTNQCHILGIECETQGKITKKHDGACEDCVDKCPLIRCGFGARCLFDPKACKNRCDCPARLCTADYKPVCGTDGKTYSNACHLSGVECETQGKTTKKHDGACACKDKCVHTKCGPKQQCFMNAQTCKPECRCAISCANVLCVVGSKCIHNKETCETKCVCNNQCPEIFTPVCGTDGKTYDNQCFLNFATCESKGKITKKHEGECKASNPVCNPTCATVYCAYGAKCVQDVKTCDFKCDCNRVCTKLYDPLCGTDGKTYGNKCLFEIAVCKSNGKIKFNHRGECKKVCNPTCATVKCAYGKCVQDPKTCDIKCDCNRPCTKEYKPICGTDGVTYGNKCIFEIAVCKSNGKLKVNHYGECKKVCNPTCKTVKCGYGAKCVQDPKTCDIKCECNNICTLEYKPVCGTDGVTYGNKCALDAAACKSNGVIKLHHYGACRKVCNPTCATVKCGYEAKCVQDYKTCDIKCDCNKPCPKFYAPVCGTNGITYDNKCFLQVATCKSNGVIKAHHNGPCKVCNPTCKTVKCGYGAKCVQDVKTCDIKCDCSRPCKKVYRPVCGSDGVTYGNLCLFKIALCKSNGKLKLNHYGRCKKYCNRPCTKEYKPICGTDGVTYGNKCLFQIAVCKSYGKLKVAHYGACKKVCNPTCATVKCGYGAKCVQDPKTCDIKCDCHRSCPKTYDPICGSDGFTYSNECAFEVGVCRSNGKLKLNHPGECKPVCNPTCATVKCGYGAKCVQDSKTCDIKCDCNRPCPDIYTPVCGSDGNTYSNQCDLEVAICKSNGKIKLNHVGECKTVCNPTCATVKCGYGARCVQDPKTCDIKCDCNRPCTREYKPICGTDGVTYSNKCMFEIAVCKSYGQLKVAHYGVCKKVCDPTCATVKCGYGAKCVQDPKTCDIKCDCKRFCPPFNVPICASNGVYYKDKCYFEEAVCESNGILKQAKDDQCKKVCNPTCATVKCAYGRCVQDPKTCDIICDCNRPCTKEYKPICGTDGVTYANKCLFEIAVCKSNGKLKIRNFGACKKVCPKDLCKPFEGECNTAIGEFCQVNNEQCTARCVCPSVCPAVFAPVCGTDGVTYGNQCQLSIQTCSTGGRITKKHDGPCKKKDCDNQCALIDCKPHHRCVNLPDECSARCVDPLRCPHNPCSGITCGKDKKCVPNFNKCAYSCQPKVCTPNVNCLIAPCDVKRCGENETCLNVCPSKCEYACEIKRGFATKGR